MARFTGEGPGHHRRAREVLRGRVERRGARGSVVRGARGRRRRDGGAVIRATHVEERTGPKLEEARGRGLGRPRTRRGRQVRTDRRDRASS